MARISEVIHVKGTDGVVQECALFDSASDIPSPAEAREFGLNGAKIYGAVLDGGDISDDGTFLLGESGTEFAFHDGSSASHLLTTPYYIRPKTESLEFGADGGTAYLEDSGSSLETLEGILSTNGILFNYSCDQDFISFVNAGTARNPRWAVVCEANTLTSERSFTLTLTYTFADGSTRDITFGGTQTAASSGGGGTGETTYSYTVVNNTSSEVSLGIYDSGGNIKFVANVPANGTAIITTEYEITSETEFYVSGAGGTSYSVTVQGANIYIDSNTQPSPTRMTVGTSKKF